MPEPDPASAADPIGGRLRRGVSRLAGRAEPLARRVGLWPFRWLARPALRLLAARSNGRPVPLSTILRLRRLAAGSDPLAPEASATDAAGLADPDLRALLGGLELGVWSLGPAGIERLAGLVRERRPELVLEFGSGVSTLCLAHAARATGGDAPGPLIVAIEQDARHAATTRSRLAAAGLASIAEVVHAPLEIRAWDGIVCSTYRLPRDFEARLEGRKADLVLVDGPAAERGARVATLPLVRRWLADGARIVLDDALRDGELEAAIRWQSSGWIRIEGIVLEDKGLLLATVRSS
jgi:predicted O-methyltransferase YrrM